MPPLLFPRQPDAQLAINITRQTKGAARLLPLCLFRPIQHVSVLVDILSAVAISLADGQNNDA